MKTIKCNIITVILRALMLVVFGYAAFKVFISIFGAQWNIYLATACGVIALIIAVLFEKVRSSAFMHNVVTKYERVINIGIVVWTILICTIAIYVTRLQVNPQFTREVYFLVVAFVVATIMMFVRKRMAAQEKIDK